MNYFVVVGGSEFQSGLVHAAQRKGHAVIVVDKNVHCFCRENFSNISFINESVREIKLVLSCLTNFNIIGAATVQSDNGVLLVEAIKEKFGLANNQFRCAQILTDKYRFKEFLFERGITKHLPFVIDESMECPSDIDWSVPRVLKPTDSSGSRGVYFIESCNQFNKVIESTLHYSWNKQAILEVQMFGTERGAQVIVQDEDHFLVINHDDVLYKNVPVAHTVLPANIILNQKVGKIIRELGLQRAFLNIDYFELEGQIEFLEIGLRLGATQLDELVSETLNRNVYDIIVENYSLTHLSKHLLNKNRTYGVLFNPYSETLDFSGLTLVGPKHFIYENVNVTVDFDSSIRFVKNMSSGVDRFGSFRADGVINDVEDLMKFILDEIT